ncbi:MAG: hypothetical protein WBD81_24520 [Collimonas pratensis]|uniref:hypothetical protein n=1 Tax=Collimonas pratensis TaxID=279113 RepID=UPI003C7549FA
MTLERWSVHRYQMPHLHLHSIRKLSDALEVDSQRGVFRISCDSAAGIDHELLPMLESLRDPRNALWSAIQRRDSGAAELLPMLRELDHLGLIRDCHGVDTGQTQQAIALALRAWSADLGRDIALHGEAAGLLLRKLAERLAADSDGPLSLALSEPSFPILTIMLQARYLRANAPSVLGLLIQGLLAAERRARLGENGAWWNGIGQLPAWAEEDWLCGLIEPHTIAPYLAAAGALLRDVFGEGAARRAHSARSEPGAALSGINFAIDLEGDVARVLADLGASAALTAVADPLLAPRVVRAAFLQEYLVTCRFVECIAPLLSRRFAEPLRSAVHRYFEEEMGHEKFERENCLRLGISAEEIDEALPMPLHLAFIDIITTLAAESPITFFCASMFTEGFIGGEDSIMSLAEQAFPHDPALLHQIGHHVAVNDVADHRGVGRDWMSRVPFVSPHLQSEVSEVLAYLAELNWRMWEQLVQTCAAEQAHGRQ